MEYYTAMRKLLSQMDGGGKALRRQLNYMFPPEQVKTAEQSEGGPEGRPGPKPSEASKTF